MGQTLLDKQEPGVPGIQRPRVAPERRLPRRIMFTSHKGGVGKTASAVNVAACIANDDRRVLLVDTDPIGSVGACFGLTPIPGHPGAFGLPQWPLEELIVPEIAPGLDLLPYAEDGRPINLNALHRALSTLGDEAAGKYDLVLIDTRPAVPDLTRRLCQVVDEVVVVFRCHPLAYRTLGAILSQLRDARSDGAESRLLGLLLTMVDATDPRQVELQAQVQRSMARMLLPISIPLDNLLNEGLMQDRPLVSYAPESPAAVAYRKLSEHLLQQQPVG
jgi:chromosome partitioning protein